MKQYVDLKEDSSETDYWMPVTNILTAALLFLLVVLVVSSAGYPQQQAAYLPDKGEPVSAASLKSKAAKLKQQEKDLTKLAGVRNRIIDELADKLSDLKIGVDIDKVSGDVRFKEAVLFGFNSKDLNKDGKQYLKEFVPVYLSVLLDKDNIKYVRQIIIEGHADDGGKYLYNLELSQNRAYNVAYYILSQNLLRLKNGTNAEKLLSVSGRSFSEPVVVNGKTDKNKSRRVEFIFRLKDDEILKQMKEIYKGVE